MERYYHGSIVYGMSFVGAYALHEEGQAQANGTYQYNLKDHLGNTRAMYSKSAGAGQAVTLVQSTDYYPFGKSFENNNVSKNRYLYNGKELQDQVIGGTAFEWYDYGARFYDPELGRFTTQDRFSEKYYELSNYQYAANNPILFIDVNGDSINVAEKYRDQFNSALESMFGANAINFSYTKSGNLVYNGSNFTIDTRNHRGGSTLTVFDSKGLSNENYVVVDPNAVKTLTVDEMGPAFYNGTPATTTNWYAHPVNVTTTTENTTWHEIGHVVYQGNTQDNVINFDNMSRSLNQDVYNYTSIRTLTDQRVYIPNPMIPRPYDVMHNRLIK